MFRAFGTARGAGTGWPVSAPPSAPRGLSAVARNSSSCPACWLAVVAFPPRLSAGWSRLSTAFRYYATIRLLSSHHHFVLSFSVVTARGCPRAEAERSPRVRTQNFVPSPSPLRAPPDGIWASPPGGGSPCGWRASSALRLCSVRHCTSDFHWTALAVPPLVSLVMGSFRHGPKWTFTSCSAPMPGALLARRFAARQDWTTRARQKWTGYAAVIAPWTASAELARTVQSAPT